MFQEVARNRDHATAGFHERAFHQLAAQEFADAERSFASAVESAAPWDLAPPDDNDPPPPPPKQERWDLGA